MHDLPFAEDDVAYVDVLAACITYEFAEQEQRQRLQFQIEHDGLTGLHNRTQFRLILREYVDAKRPFASAYIDLDRFRTINEMVGNMVADEVLVEIAAALAGVDDRDFVARTSGDGFAIILPGADSIAAANDRLSNYARLFKKPFHTGDLEGTRMLSVAASFGAARYPVDGSSAEELVRAADVALEAAKTRGGDRIVFFDREMTANLEQNFLQSAELSEAIDNDGLVLYYQPTFSLATRAITGAEALVRWNHPTRGHL
jgi:diguanylate cyclase (GGDEF)-like protein